ncbi:MAG: ChaN family lipoprotein [Cytophagaceae bacterium]
MKLLVSLIFLVFTTSGLDNDKPAYRIFDKQGKTSDYSTLLKNISRADIILFGELHNNSIVHWLELQLLKDLAVQNKRMVLAVEFLETDNQLAISEFNNGLIRLSQLENEIKLWSNYKTDYRPLLEFAGKSSIPVIATSVPRRYASVVAYKGFSAMDTLPLAAKAYLPPLPINFDPMLPGYAQLKDGMSGHAMAYMAESQALKDATMAWNINKVFSQNMIFHINGAYHSDNFEGIYWYLRNYNPKLKIVTITCKEQKDISKAENENTGIADYLICIPEDMIKSY